MLEREMHLARIIPPLRRSLAFRLSLRSLGGWGGGEHRPPLLATRSVSVRL